MRWTERDIGDVGGRTVIVTGPTSGIGFHTARALAEHGARVVLACRDEDKGRRARELIGHDHLTSVLKVDLGDLGSVRRAASRFADDHDRLDALVNNAGVMTIDLRRTTDGFESQMGVNHLGHFALTALLFPIIAATAGARVVTVSSNAHRFGRVDLDDPHWRARRFRAWAAYGASKLANLLFAFELHRRLTASGSMATSVAAHPGMALTNLGYVKRGERLWWLEPVGRAAFGLVAQGPEMGALPTLRATVDPDAAGGSYWGPGGRGGARGHPVPVHPSPRALDPDAARDLWAFSERETGVRFAA